MLISNANFEFILLYHKETKYGKFNGFRGHFNVVGKFSKPIREIQKSISGITKKLKDTRLDKLSKDINDIETRINNQDKLKFKLSEKFNPNFALELAKIWQMLCSCFRKR